MNAQLRIVLVPLFLGLAAGACGSEDASHEGELEDSFHMVSSENGLRAINGLTAINGLRAINGLSTINSLRSPDGLRDGSTLMSTHEGRQTVSYMARCALPAGRSITKKDQFGNSYTFSGALGMAPTWENGSCDTKCQEYVSACMVAHINTSGVNVPLWVVADPSSQPQIGWGLSSSFPNQEGSFFGNIFIDPPIMNFCDGPNIGNGVVPGRIGSDNFASRPYKNPFGNNGKCNQNCAAADFPNSNSGYKACAGYNGVVTVWRQ